ncbi:hypothetical protein [Paenibacillus alginolyticus]|uniref:Uncharacterized protein n=1 Tax=Paenibacillus alginolyticus TaxID=59839 RepID=A0ABT4G6T5_9BACL|nr:hypothetical protein [Paenibacillus alginolyticus]MCY9691870.1 hypothetical protein [Paenibacillus alginolyticus]MEC0144594.1 hypothetical protein [Paenibacillus alginolyticus]
MDQVLLVRCAFLVSTRPTESSAETMKFIANVWERVESASEKTDLQSEKAAKAVSEDRKQRKWRETSEKDLSAAESRRVSGFAA